MIEKILTCIFFPPGGFVFLLFISGLLIARGKRKSALYLVLFSAVFLYFLSTKAGSELFLRPLEDSYPQPAALDGDVIVVLGGGEFGHCPDGICVSLSSMKRCMFAFFIQKRDSLPIIVAGGKLFGMNRTEAEVMGDFLSSLGAKGVVEEKRTINTWEQGKVISGIMRERGWKKAILVTSAFHMRRAVYSLQKNGVIVIPAPTDYRTDREGSVLSYLLPDSRHLNQSFLALHEYIGLLYYRLRR